MPRSRSVRIAFALVMFLVRAEPRAWAQAQDLQKLLDRTSRQVVSFLDQVSDVKCTEQVTQEKLSPKGKTEYSESGTYDYLVLLSGGEDELQLNESRLASKQNPPGKNIPLLISNGFSTLFLMFHPYYRSSFRFEAEPDGTIDGQVFARVRFSHVEGARTPAALAVRGREFPLDLSGTAWIDPATGSVAHIEAALGKDMKDVGLRTLTVVVDYAPVRQPGWSQADRFPAVATVEVETLRQHWRNVHRFTQYKRFMVDTQETVAADKIGKK